MILEDIQELRRHLTIKLRFNESAGPAWALRQKLAIPIGRHAEDGEATLSEQEAEELASAVRVFDSALQLELQRAPIFLVTSRGVFDTRLDL